MINANLVNTGNAGLRFYEQASLAHHYADKLVFEFHCDHLARYVEVVVIAAAVGQMQLGYNIPC